MTLPPPHPSTFGTNTSSVRRTVEQRVHGEVLPGWDELVGMRGR